MPDIMHCPDIKLDRGEQRLSWVDTAKGIAILVIILGHTALKNSLIWNWCYTFHVPMFFILSGYTSKVADNWSNIWVHVKKNFLRLIVPCLCVEVIQIFAVFFLAGKRSFDEFVSLLAKQVETLFWASGATNADGTIPSLGALWFLIALFHAKTLWDIIHVLLPKGKTLICFMVGFLGMVLGEKTYLPQELDVVLLVVLFLEFGKCLKKFSESMYYDKFKYIVLLICFVVWMVCYCFGIRIEIVYRDYPYGVISIIEACCATYCMCILARRIDDITVVRNILSYIGRYSLWIYMVHSVDYLFGFIWEPLHSGFYIIVIRVIVDVSIALLLAHMKYFEPRLKE